MSTSVRSDRVARSSSFDVLGGHVAGGGHARGVRALEVLPDEVDPGAGGGPSNAIVNADGNAG